MGGRFRLDSEPGQGSTFAFSIQLQRGHLEERNLRDAGVHWHNVRIMVVDDMPEIREYFLEAAAQLRIACSAAASGEEALRLIERDGPCDIYFIDWKMPGLDGIETATRIKASGADKAVVIMISSGEWNKIEAEAERAGVNGFLPKPIFHSDIVDCLNQCLGKPETGKREDPAGEEENRFAGYRLLLAEDVEINREIALALLEHSGLVIDCAENGREAVRMFQAAPGQYDAIFMDIQMPEMDGYEATRGIRALEDPAARGVPIIAMTANVFREDIGRCLAAGMNDHTGKPLDIADVMRKLRKYLPARPAGRA
jgi:CheY-like chemotaxis protein